MRAGIIAEYNPFHKGHEYQIKKLRELGAENIVIAMSGNYVQRGEPSVLDKFLRSEIALKAGADMVLELPQYVATASAEEFAAGGIRLLTQAGCDVVCFGIKAGSERLLELIADELAEESLDYKKRLSDALKEGCSFPSAREKALCEALKLSEADREHFHEVISDPNNILAIEYLKAVKRQGAGLEVVMLERQGAAYNDTKARDGYASASHIRCLLLADEEDEAYEYMPDYGRNAIERCPWFLSPDDFSQALYQSIVVNMDNLEGFRGVTGDVADRIRANIYSFRDFSGFADVIKTKNITRTAVSRLLLHIMLQQADDDDSVVLLGVKSGKEELISLARSGLGDRLVISQDLQSGRPSKQVSDADLLYYGVRAMKYPKADFTPAKSKYLLKV